jgi:hypothetical protein
MHIPTVMAKVAPIGAKIAMIVFHVIAVGTNVGSLFGSSGGVAFSDVLS